MQARTQGRAVARALVTLGVCLGFPPAAQALGVLALDLRILNRGHVLLAEKIAEEVAQRDDQSLQNGNEVRPLGNGPPVRKPIEVRISGKDADKVFEIADGVKQWLNDRDDTRNVGDDWGPKVKKLVIEVSEDRARRARPGSVRVPG